MKSATVELLAKDLNHQGGVFCPSPLAQMKDLDTHPKVYLDVGKVCQEAKCPVSQYGDRLKPGEHFGAGH